MTWVWGGGGGSEEQAAAKEQKVSPCNDSSENTALKKKKLLTFVSQSSHCLLFLIEIALQMKASVNISIFYFENAKVAT